MTAFTFGGNARTTLASAFSRALSAAVATPFRITFLVFCAVEAMFVFVANVPWIYRNAGLSYLFHHDRLVMSHTTFLISLVHILVTINTVLFIVESTKLMSHKTKLASHKRGSFNLLFYVFVAILVSSVAISAIVGWNYLVSFFATDIATHNWISDLHSNEKALICLFFLFVLADGILLHMCSIFLECATEGDSLDQVKKFRITTDHFLRACDVPGLLGILLIWVLSRGVPLDLFDRDHSPLAAHYLQGFIVGAVGLHIAFSQAILAFLSEPEDE
ncbi:hypothetical protein KQX63_12205 [Rhodopseudomonas palustris]|uniref:hypothetical protein n=1 Tax=Rhodopseudomonas palustris TaxID=1076 RepID=UPI0021F3697F|nr:hypothetical protein [Rhodopseudomonas palustris]UYO42186.1 hypothetical protein KQX63_12205 [Rhodopseudomonas palustris]